MAHFQPTVANTDPIRLMSEAGFYEKYESKGAYSINDEEWLGGLDSNQDNQIQNLMYCQLYDLPAEDNKKGRSRDPLILY